MSLHEKVLVIGIDGATFDLLTPWLADGRLPHLSALTARGVSAVLRSTMPANSAPAWTSFMTGMNPGKHGIYGFTRVEPEKGYTIKVNTGANRRAPTVWQYLSRLGKRSIVLNMPMTYPPDPIAGIVVSGITTPGIESEFTYPPALRTEILRRIPEYQLDVRSWGVTSVGERRAQLMEDISRMVESRRQLGLHLFRTEPWDLFALIFTATDRVMHFFWRFLDPQHPLYDAAEAPLYRDAILRIHQQIDAAIGELLEVCGEDTAVIVMSDHGFGPQHKLFRINQWLLENQFLQLTFSGENGRSPGLNAGAQKWLYRGVSGAVDLARAHLSDGAKDRLKQLFPRLRERLASQTVFSGVDWTRTRAYHTAEFPGSIRINLRGRETQGIVVPGAEYDAVCADLQTRLQALTDPQSGRRIVARVFRREELYSGPQLAKAPDLTVHLADYAYTFDWYMPVGNGKDKLPVIDDLRGKYAVNCGYHRPDGILMMAGTGIRSGPMPAPANIEDVIPTILYLLGVPVPEDMDGQVLTTAVLPEQLRIHEIEFGPPLLGGAHDEADGELYTAEEAEAVKNRLRDLGYL